MVEEGRLKDPVKVIRRAERHLTLSGAEKFYDFLYEDGTFEIIEKTVSIDKARALGGYYILKTTALDLKDEEVERHYKGLKWVEDSFRELKDWVEVRPIFHWKERRVKTHVFLCILAQTVINQVRETLKQSRWLEERKENSFSSFLDLLYQINLGIFEIEKVETKVITPLTQEEKKILKIFQMEEKYFTHFDKAKERFRSVV